MLMHPKIGELVELRYRPAMRRLTGLHGSWGIVRIVSSGPGPRNHGVEIETTGELVVVPAGNIRRRKR
jgi:hypothetical protein